MFFILNAACTLTFTLYLYLPLLWNAPIIFIYLALSTRIFLKYIGLLDNGLLPFIKEYLDNLKPEEYSSFPSLYLCIFMLFLHVMNCVWALFALLLVILHDFVVFTFMFLFL